MYLHSRSLLTSNPQACPFFTQTTAMVLYSSTFCLIAVKEEKSYLVSLSLAFCANRDL
jgi:hypothetical protein